MGEEMTEQMREENFQDYLFQLTMKKKWKQVVEIYKEDPPAHKTKLTRSEETSFHIAISNYHPKSHTHATYVEQMIDLMEKEGSLIDVLSMQNVRGDTPLHLAAAVGSAAICECIANKDRELITIRNARGETPLFVAANHGKLQAFLCLHELYNDKSDEQTEPDESICRRKDGNTILHSAIFGEYFALAYQIIIYYPKLLNSVNADGEFPLHVLAKKPNVFKSSRQLGFYDSIIYHCVFVDKLKQQGYNRRVSQNGYSHGRGIKYPETYATCVNIFLLLWTPLYESCLDTWTQIIRKCNGDLNCNAGYRRCKEGNSGSTDEENQEHRQKEHEIEDAKRKTEEDAFFPANYTTCTLLFKFMMKVILIVVGVGYWRIKKIQEKRVRHSHAKQIMNKMIEFEPRYKYDSHGHRPSQKLDSQGIEIPNEPPHADQHNDQQRDENEKDQNKSVGKGLNVFAKMETPLLVAAKMGIPEMVKKIVSTYPVAIEDHDSDGKNALMLAAENRHTSVFDYLLKTDFPEYVFHQVDNQENSILHLAAKLGETQPWRIPGAALQMQWEIKWYEHVKGSIPPLSFAHHNAKGETPRKIFTRTHECLVKEGNEWLIKTSESCSVVAALIATVAFATSATVPGGLDQESGHPILKDHKAFDIFSVTSLVALCLAVTALVFFLAIITSRFEERDFRTNLPRKLLMGLSCLFSSIAAMLLSFCAGHTFILREKLRLGAVPIYAVATIPVTFFAIAQLPLYFDLLWAACRRVPLRSYKLFHE